MGDGDWGGSEMLGREALYLAAVVRGHFGMTVAEVGEAVHSKRVREERLGELAPAIVAAAADGDAVARQLVERLAGEVALLAKRALADLGVVQADVVLGGGMLNRGEGLLWDEVVARLPASARPVAVADPPVLGAVPAALDDAGATPAAKANLRASFRDGLAPDGG